MNKCLLYIAILSGLILFTKCAQQTALGGGEKDTTPPELDSLKAAQPENGSTNFSGSQITIYFDEMVTLKNPEKEILITPFLDVKPEIYAKGKKIHVNFKGSLEDQTTYIVNFGKSIVDLTEGNPMVNYKYVFSTGSVIDSLEYEAVVYDAYYRSPARDIYVMLYREHSDSVLIKEKPSYFGITDATGKCRIGNIAGGSYKVVAFKEDNSDYKWNSKNESIAFSERIYNAETDTIVDTLKLFKNRPEEIKINEIKISTDGKVVMSLNGSIDQSDLSKDTTLSAVADVKTISISPQRDTVTFWLLNSLKPGEKYSFGLDGIKSQKENLPTLRDTSLRFKTNTVRGLKPMEDIKFDFSQPIAAIDKNKVFLKLDSTNLDFEIVQTTANQILIASDLIADESYELLLLPGAITSTFGLKNDTIQSFLDKKEEKDFGNLITSFKVPEGNYIVHLLKEGKIIHSDFPNGNDFTRSYAYLEPGNYRIRLTFDENQNQIWDTGDYFNHQFPERVEYYDGVIEIKKGWDMEINWEIKR